MHGKGVLMKVTIVIPNYNGCHFLKRCLPSLARQSFSDFTTILVDNGSSDTSISYVTEHFPDIQILPQNSNLGFARAVNIGIRASQTPYVLLLNTDTVLHPDFLLHMVKCMESSDDIFSVSSKMLQADHPKYIDSAGDLYTLPGWAVCRGKGLSSSGFRKNKTVFSACAGAALYRRSAFAKIGFFDSDFFAYLEDVDLGYRAQLHGWKNVYCADALVLHTGSGTTGHGYSDFKVYHSARNNIYLLYKNTPASQLLFNLPFFTLGSLLKYHYFKKRGFGSAYRNGIKDGLRTFRARQKFPFDKSSRLRAWKLEGQLFKNTFVYLRDYLLRQLFSFTAFLKKNHA